jgi:hypothetical protein
MQLHTYEEYNAFLKELHDVNSAKAKEEEVERMKEVMEERKAIMNTDEGESLSIDDISDIYIQVRGEERTKNNFSLNTVNKDGSIADYLEARRPWGTSQ